MFRVFDFASPDQSSAGRSRTTVPQQALFLLNARSSSSRREALAARAKSRRATGDRGSHGLYRHVLGARPPHRTRSGRPGSFIRARTQPRTEAAASCPPGSSPPRCYSCTNELCTSIDLISDLSFERHMNLSLPSHVAATSAAPARAWGCSGSLACWPLPGCLRRAPLRPNSPASSPTGYVNPLAPKQPHFAAKAKRVIHLFMNGGPSHVDTFDPKPALDKYAGKPLPTTNLPTERKTGAAFPSPFKFQKYGQSGIEVSELFAHDGRARRRHLRHPLDARRRAEPRAVADADELRRRPADPAERGLVGHLRPGHREPEPARLHRHVPRRLSDPGDAELAGRLPARRLPGHVHRHAAHRDREADREHPQRRLAAAEQRRQLDLLAALNEQHREQRGDDPQLEARIQSFELAYRMQTEAADAFDVSREPKHVRDVYGDGMQARQMLIARRLLERGVRFVQVWHGAGPAVGQPRRHRGQPPQAWPASATRPSPRCSPT